MSDPQRNTSALPVSPEEYNSFIEGVELRSIRLARCSVEALGQYDDSALTPEVEEVHSAYESVEGGFVVYHELMFSGKSATQGLDPVVIQATFELIFESESQISDDIFAVFKRVNLPVNIWPFFREFVHTVLARVNWPVFLLPALKIGNFGAKAQRRRRSLRPLPSGPSADRD